MLLQKFERWELLRTVRARILGRTQSAFQVRAQFVLPSDIFSTEPTVKHKPPVSAINLLTVNFSKRPDASLLLILVPLNLPCFVSLVFAGHFASEVTTLTWCHFVTNISPHFDVVTITHVLILVRRCYAGVNKKPFWLCEETSDLTMFCTASCSSKACLLTSPTSSCSTTTT